MAAFAIFDRDLKARARRQSTSQQSRDSPRTSALTVYDPNTSERSDRRSYDLITSDRSDRRSSSRAVQFEEPGRSSSPNLALVRRKGSEKLYVEDLDNEITTNYGYRPLSFEQAASTLFYRLRTANLFYTDFENSFRYETQAILHWAPRKTLDMLWRTKTDWDGEALVEYEANPYANSVGGDNHYNRHISILRNAWADLRNAPSVPSVVFEYSNPRLSSSDVKSVMKKLQITFEEIEEMWETVRVDHLRMRSLTNRLKDAMEILVEIDAVWNRPDYGDQGTQSYRTQTHDPGAQVYRKTETRTIEQRID